MLLGAVVGAAMGIRRRAGHLAVLGLIVVVSLFFYFLVDVRDHQHVYVGWRAGHLMFIAFAPLVGFAVQELWSGGRLTRLATFAVGGLLALAAAPMTAIDLYNTQDTSNQTLGPGFRWTVVLTPDELEAMQWIKRTTPPDALVQIEPNARSREMWAYIPAFAERRMVAGLPISMIPLHPYEVASARVREVFLQKEPVKAYWEARDQRFDYLFVGSVERKAYPHLEPLLDTVPHWFRPVFRNPTVTIYHVACDVANLNPSAPRALASSACRAPD